MSVHLNCETAIPATNLFVPNELGQLSVIHNGREFFVVDSEKVRSEVSPVNLSKELRGISAESLKKVLAFGYLKVSKIGEDYAVRFNERLPGGGPFGAFLTYVGMNVVGGAMVVVGTLTAPVGGAVIVAAGVATVTAAPVVAGVMVATPTP